MLEQCARKARNQKLHVMLYKQFMQELNLAQLYGTIYVPSCSFMLVTDQQQAGQALQRFYDHLQPNGQLLLSLYNPKHEIVEGLEGTERLWKDVVWHERESAYRLQVYETVNYQQVEKLRIGSYRFELYQNGILQTTEVQTIMWRWYDLSEIVQLLEQIGFCDIHAYGDYTLEPATQYHETLIIRAIK